MTENCVGDEQEGDMDRISKSVRVAQLAVTLLSATALKAYYSTASVNDLGWVLAPTRFFVELATGEHFVFESYAGYMNSDHSFLIAASCAGVNFLIAAFLMLAIARILRSGPRPLGWGFIPVSAVTAYLTTIVANTVRISTALHIRHMDPELIWINPDQLHRFEGIFIYFGFLLLLYVVSERVNKDRTTREMRSHWLRRFSLPLAIYYATTLGIPLINGAYSRSQAVTIFREHFFFVLITPLLLLAPLAVYHFIRHRHDDLRVEFLSREANG